MAVAQTALPKGSFYLGNAKLKRAGVVLEWTPEQEEEYKKCAADPIYFAEKYVKIVHVDHGFIDIVLYDYQKEIIKTFNSHRRTSVVTSRQAGKTTTAVVLILHYILFNEHKLVGLLANKGDASREILHRIQLAYEALPFWLQAGVVEWNKGSVSLENGCRVIASATSSSAIRGQSCAMLYIDETAFVEGWEEFSASVLPTISSGKTTQILYTSTPNGLNHYWTICEGAKQGTNGYGYVEVPWTRVPGRDDKWKQGVLADLNHNIEKFSQEYECSFIGSSSTLISGAVLKLLKPRVPIQSKDGLRMFKEPKKGHTYAIICDVSRGKGLDYSAFQVIDTTSMPYRQVCVYQNNMVTPTDYASIIFRAAKTYNNAHALIELNDIGGQVATLLAWDYEYENVLSTENAGTKGKRITLGGGNGVEHGIRTTAPVKKQGCAMLKLLVEQKQLDLIDGPTIYELSRFSAKGQSYEAEPGAHDDTVMGLVLFAWLTQQEHFKELHNADTLARLRDMNEAEMNESFSPFGFSLDYHADNAKTPTAYGIDTDLLPWAAGLSFF